METVCHSCLVFCKVTERVLVTSSLLYDGRMASAAPAPISPSSCFITKKKTSCRPVL